MRDNKPATGGPADSTVLRPALRFDIRAYAPVAIVACVGIAVSFAGWELARYWERQKAQQAFEYDAGNRAGFIQRELDKSVESLASIAGLYTASHKVERAEFRVFTRPVLRRRSGVRALSWLPRVAGVNRRSFERAASRETAAPFHITERGEDGALAPTGRREVYFPVLFTARLDDRRIQRFLGFDSLSSPVRRTAMMAARDAASPVATGPIRLALSGMPFGHVVFHPVYRTAAIIETVAQRRAALIGFVAGAFDLRDLTRYAQMSNGSRREMVVRLYDGSARTGGRLLYHQSPEGSAAGPAPDAETPTGAQFAATLRVAGRSLTAVFSPSRAGDYGGDNRPALGVLVAGLVLTVLLSIYLRAVIGRNERTTRLLGGRTRELAAANDSLRAEAAEREHAQAGLGESETRYRTLVQASPEAIFIHCDGKLVFANPAMVKLLGAKSLDEIMGIDPFDFIHPGDRELVLELRRELRRADGPAKLAEMRYRMSDGGEALVETSSAPFSWEGRPARIVMSRDITERKRAETALRESDAQMRLVTDAVPARIAYIDRDHRIRFANKPYSDWFGVAPDEIVGRHLREVRGAELYERDIEYTIRALAGEEVSNEPELRMEDGRSYHYRSIRVPHFADDGAVLGYFVITVDLTEHHQREEQLRHAQKMEAVGQLTGGVAHEFNNLLMIVLGNIELLEEKLPADEEMLRLVENAKRGAVRGGELTQRLLAFSRRQTLSAERVDLHRLVLDTVDMLRRSLGETVTITAESAPDLWPVVADPGQIEAALLNFAINSRHAMPTGGAIVVRTANAILDDDAVGNQAPPGEYVVLEVDDTGTGMTEEVIGRAFEPFYTTKEVGEGSGLGLSMAYGFAKQSGGFVEIDSTPGRGTTIRLYLPRAAERGTDGTADAATARSPQRGEGTILVVEDDAELRGLVVKMIRQLGYRVIAAPDGHAALALLGADSDIDLLFTDVVLPGGLSGPDLARSARARRPALRVVFTTGYSDEALGDIEFDGAASTVVGKPYRQAELAETLAQTLAPTLGAATSG